MNDTPEKKNDTSYLPVLRLWARTEFLRLCLAVAHADSPVAKAQVIEDLKNEAPRLSAVMLGIDMLDDTCAVCVDARISELERIEVEQDDRISELVGQLGVARDLLRHLMETMVLSPQQEAAVNEWLADVAESCEQEETFGAQSTDSN